jgi:hypothetical protein
MPRSADTATRQIQTPSQVMELWHAALVSAGAPNSRAVAYAILEFVRRSRVLLTREPQPLIALYTSLPEGQSQVIGASPLWLSESDWKEGVDFLHKDGEGPRLLVIENFDTGLQEAYLLPALLAWLSSVPHTSSNRVVLVPSGAALDDVSPRILEFATCLAYRARDLGWPQCDDGTMRGSQEQLVTINDLVRFETSTNPASETAFSKFLRNQRVFLPYRLVRVFVSLDEGLRCRFPAREARVLAQEATFIPWAERACSETHVMMLRNPLDALDEP